MKLFFLVLLVASQMVLIAQTPEAAINKGNNYYRQQQYNLAENQYQAALEKTPGNTAAQYNLAAALYRQKKWGEAHGVLKKLAEAATDTRLKSSTHYNNGVIYSNEKNLEKSIEAYKAALRLLPDDTKIRENLQKALAEQKRQQQQKKEQEKKQQKSSMNQKEAEQRLKLLQEREKQLQERLQKGGQKGQSMPKDW